MKMSSESFNEFKDKFENMITTKMAEMHIPGLSVALVKDDQVIYARGFGARNLKDNLPATPDTLYGIGSCTKSFTALAIMQLVEQEKLDLQDPVNKYLSFKLGRKDSPITIHHLLTMSSGIPDLGVATILIDKLTGAEKNWIPMSSIEDLMLYINGASEEIVDEPGNRFFYLNTGYTLLGKIVEKISKTPYEKYVTEKILKPLKMERSTFLEKDFNKDTNVMTAYLTQNKEGKVIVTPSKHPFHKFMYAPGGLLSSVMELTHYLSANINGGIYKENIILDSSLMNNMHSIQFETDINRSYFLDHGKTGYGYGWSISNDFIGHKLIIHGGSTRVSSAQLMFIPELKIGLAALVNASPGPFPILLNAIAFLMGKDPEKEILDFEIEKKLNLLTGEYASYKGIFKVSIVKKGSIIFFESKQRGMLRSFPLIPETDKLENYKFYTPVGPGRKMTMVFTVDPTGKIDLYDGRVRYHKIIG